MITPFRRSRLAIAARLLAAVVVFASAGCSSDDEELMLEVACPRVAVLSEAGQLTRFASDTGKDLLDVDFEAEFSDVFAGCRVIENENGQPVLLIALAPEVVVSLGPANKTQRADFMYFVSLIEDNVRILNKSTFPVSLAFSGNRRQLFYRDDNPPVTVDVPWTEDTDTLRYEVLVGFQLTRKDLQYNRDKLEWQR